MRSERFQTSLAHPPNVVSAFLAHLENDPLWRREIVGSALVEGESGTVGARYDETVDWEGVQARVPLRIAEYTVPERLLLISEEPGYRGTSEYTFAPDGTGTALTLTQSVETSGALKLVEPFMWAVIARWVGRDIRTLDDAIAASEAHARVSG